MQIDPAVYAVLTDAEKKEIDQLIFADIKARCERIEGGLEEFVKYMWSIVEPTRPLVWGKHLTALCVHLSAVASGDITRLLINIPPGHSKSIMLNVFFPAWMWGPMKKPGMRFIGASYSEDLTLRDNVRFRDVISSIRYQQMWGKVFKVRSDQDSKSKIGNDKTGWKIATSVGGLGTGERCDVFSVDDPHDVKGAESDAMRENTLQWWREVVPTRMNDPEKSCIIVIMQRLHENDVSGDILSRNLPYEHLCLPARYDPDRRCGTAIGWEDWRTEPDELLWAERFSETVLDDLESAIGKFAFASQFMQSPMPRGGGILKREYWQLWPPEGKEQEWTRDGALQFPTMDYVVASFDGAYTEKQENDYSALGVFGVFRENGMPKIMLMHYWQQRLTLNDAVTKIGKSCQRYKIDKLLIEAKATGISVAQELRRIYGISDWSTELITPKGDKVARVYSIQHLFEEKMIFAPDREWAETLIGVCERFPRGTHDDGVDVVSQACSYLRNTGWALRRGEISYDKNLQNTYDHVRAASEPPLYDV